MAGEVFHRTVDTVLCCKCGIPTLPNIPNMCVKCLCSEVNITLGLQPVAYCPKCGQYWNPPVSWIRSSFLYNASLTFCLNSFKNLNQVRLVDAECLSIESHPNRVRLLLTVHHGVLNRPIFQQTYELDYVVQDSICETCYWMLTPPDSFQWVSTIKLRQPIPRPRTLLYLQQLIIKHGAAAEAIRIQSVDRGVDFFFSDWSNGVNFLKFISNLAPIKSFHDKQPVFHDDSIISNYEHTFAVEICPICREDLVCLPPQVAVSLGNLGPLVICTKITNSIALLDPLTLRHCFLDAGQFWSSPFRSLRTTSQLVEYKILNVEIVSSEMYVDGMKYVLADAEVARVSDFGKNDTRFSIRTHLGHILNHGDYALGYDLYSADIELNNRVLPQAVLIKKSYEEKRAKPLWCNFPTVEDLIADLALNEGHGIVDVYEEE